MGIILLVISISLGKANAEKPSAEGFAPAAISDFFIAKEQKVSIDRDPDAHRYRPQVAFNYNHNEYLVVWHNTWADGDRYIYGRRLDLNGNPIGTPFSISCILNEQVHPFVVYNGTNDVYFVVWMYDGSGDNTNYQIWGSIIPWNAASCGSVFRVDNFDTSLDLWYPSAAWDSVHNEYMVIWDTYTDGKDAPQSIGYRRVLSYMLFGTSGTITTAKSPKESDIVYNPAADKYVVVWSRKVDDVSTERNIQGALLNWDGSTNDADFFVYGDWDDHRNPAIATNQQVYMVVLEAWSDWFGHWGDVLLPFDLSGTELNEIAYFQTIHDFKNPDIAARGTGGEFMWTYEIPWGTHTGLGYTTISYVHPNYDVIKSDSMVDSNWYRREPSIAGNGPGYLITYTGRSSNPSEWQHIYAIKLWQNTLFFPLVMR